MTLERGSTKPITWSERHIITALQRRYLPGARERREWALVQHLRVGANDLTPDRVAARLGARQGAETDWEPSEDFERELDAWAMHAERRHYIAFEVKVDKIDFIREVNDPHKRAAAMALSNEYYFATQQGLLEEDEIPEGCGLIEVKRYSRGGLTTGFTTAVKVPAPWRDIDPIPRSLFFSLAVKASL